jgi:uncharacterized protein (DUF58 family)
MSTAESLLKRLNWRVLKPLAQLLGGNERLQARGAGLEIDELREYQPGDDVRRIDWNVSARQQRPFVRVSRLERAVDVWLIVDISASLDFGSEETLKRERAEEFVAVVSQLFARQGHRVGMILFDDDVRSVVSPERGRAQVVRLLDSLASNFSTPKQQGTDKRPSILSSNHATLLSPVLFRVSKLVQRKSLVIVISDFFAGDNWSKPLRRLSARHETLCVQIYDPYERDLPDAGFVELEDPETGEQLEVDLSDEDTRRQFQNAASAQAEQIHHAIKSAGAEHFVVSTTDDLLKAMMRFLQRRKLRRAAQSRLARQRATHSGVNMRP